MVTVLCVEERDFRALDNETRRDFIVRRPGFMQAVANKLREQGQPCSVATVSRTWNGLFRTPNPAVVDAIQALYNAELNS